MSKFICATSTTRNTNSSSHHQNRQKYISPLEKLDERTKNWQSGRVQEENRLKQLYEEGKCNLFRPLSSYRYYHSHKNTPIDLLDDLIDYAKVVQHYTIDTEDQLVPKRPSIPALIQVEYVYEDNPSILLLIECMHLPERNEPTFIKIKQLFKIIFSMGHTIYSWGNLCGLDLALHTINVPRQFMYMQGQVIQDEKEIRELLITYALNDCLGVTKLVNKLPSPTKSSTSTTTCNDIFTHNYYEEEYDDVFSSDEINYHVEINAPNDGLTLNGNDISDELKQNSLTGVYVRDEPYEMISDNVIDDISLPEITKLHLPLKQHHLNESQERVHGQGKSLNEIEIISDDDIEQYTTTRPFQSQQHQSLTRNQSKNRKKRARRYRFE
ncbi:unnamed protein product, partial [Rotaria sordida]